jgi:hypothetical protein
MHNTMVAKDGPMLQASVILFQKSFLLQSQTVNKKSYKIGGPLVANKSYICE